MKKFFLNELLKLILSSMAIPLIIYLITKGSHPFGAFIWVFLWLSPPLILYPAYFLINTQGKKGLKWAIFIIVWILLCIAMNFLIIHKNKLGLSSRTLDAELIILFFGQIISLFIAVNLSRILFNLINNKRFID